jgi:hypothetical protein
LLSLGCVLYQKLPNVPNGIVLRSFHWLRSIRSLGVPFDDYIRPHDALKGETPAENLKGQHTLTAEFG